MAIYGFDKDNVWLALFATLDSNDTDRKEQMVLKEKC